MAIPGYSSDPDYQAARRRQQQARANAQRQASSTGNRPTGTSYGTGSQPWYMNPNANARPDTQYWWANQVQGSQNMTPGQQATMQRDLFNAGVPYNQAIQPYGVNTPQFPMTWGGGGGRGGGGGGGGGGGPAGLDQGTLDWMMAQLRNQPQGVSYRDLDLPDPSQYMRWDPAQFNVARQGVTSGIEGIRGRANTAYDQAAGELARYQNPFAGQLQQVNPDLFARLGRTAQQNNAQQALGQTFDEGVQADRAMSNQMAMLAANDQARQAANQRALAGDRRTTEQNLGLEGNMLNLGVNMAEARGRTAFDQRLQDAMLQAAQQEAMQNYSRRNEVEATNATAYNQWLNNAVTQLLQLAGQRAPGTNLPPDMSWLQANMPGVGSLMGGSLPVPQVAQA